MWWLGGGGTFERWFSHKGGAFMNEVSALIKETLPELSQLLPCDDEARR